MLGTLKISSAFKGQSVATWSCLVGAVVLGVFFVGSYRTFTHQPRNMVITTRLSQLPVQSLPCRLDLSDRVPNQPHKLGGWSYPEVWGTWTDGRLAFLGARFPETAADRTIAIDFEIDQVCLAPISSHPPLALEVWINDTRVDTWELTVSAPAERQVRTRLPATDPALLIAIVVHNPVKPDSYGSEGDFRDLGLGLAAVRFSLPDAPTP